jgi:ornithine cyclodeaminase/alanine dehydrogenase-like protein (mu-crystallin family)
MKFASGAARPSTPRGLRNNTTPRPWTSRQLSGADVVVTATNAREPILKGAWLKPGSYVNGVGSPRPTWRALDDEAMTTSTVIVDSREAALKESGDVMGSKAPIYAEVGEIFAGKKPLPLGQTTVFRSVGIAIEDIATAKLVYDACR